MHVSKVRHVTSIKRVAEELGEDEDWLPDVANEMEIEHGAIWVYVAGEHGMQALTDFGIENLIELVRMYRKARSRLSARRQNNPMSPRSTRGCARPSLPRRRALRRQPILNAHRPTVNGTTLRLDNRIGLGWDVS